MWTRRFVRMISELNTEDKPRQELRRLKTLAIQIEEERRSCSLCKRIHDQGEDLAPRHNASPACESGSRPHCTCDICF
jgi:hypothetical protein